MVDYHRRGLSVFRSAITDRNGDVDAGYLALYAGGWIILGAIPVALILVTVRMLMVVDHPLDLVGVAAIIGAAGTCFGILAGGIGAFRAGDKEKRDVDVSDRGAGVVRERSDERVQGQ